jgi:hypothetical protein
MANELWNIEDFRPLSGSLFEEEEISMAPAARSSWGNHMWEVNPCNETVLDSIEDLVNNFSSNYKVEIDDIDLSKKTAEDLIAEWEERHENKFRLLFMPFAQQIAARTIGLDLVSVQPMSAPIGSLYYAMPTNQLIVNTEEGQQIMNRDEDQGL